MAARSSIYERERSDVEKFMDAVHGGEVSKPVRGEAGELLRCSKEFFIDPWYNQAERTAIRAVANIPQEKPTRVIPEDLGVRPLRYRANKGITYRAALHAGQRKLYMSELDFLTGVRRG